MDIKVNKDQFKVLEVNEIISSTNYKQSSKATHASTQKKHFIQTFTLDVVQSRILQKIANQIKTQIKLGIDDLINIKTWSFQQNEQNIKIRIVSKFTTAKSLKKIINNKKNFPIQNEPLELMQQTANILSFLHAKGIVHADVTLNNVFYKKSETRMVLGRPRLRQIDKFLRMPSLKERLILIAPEISLGYTSSYASDVWQLGVVFLQLALNEDIQKSCENRLQSVIAQINKVKNQHLKDLLKRMLCQHAKQRPSISEVMKLLKQIGTQQYPILQRPVTEKFYYRVFQLDIFNQTVNTEQTLKKVEQSQIQQLSNSFKILYHFFFKKGYIITIIPKNNSMRRFTLYINMPSQLSAQLKTLESQFGFKTRLTHNGRYVVYILIDPNTKIPLPLKEHKINHIINNQLYLRFDRSTIKKANKSTRGLYLSQTFALTASKMLNDNSKQALLFFNQRIVPVQISKIQFFQDYPKNVKSYCLIQLSEINTRSCPYFKILLKNYNEETIDAIASSSQAYYNYQISEYPFKKDEITFSRQSHQFTFKDNGQILPGEPLTINFSNDNYAVIGIYIGEGRGITFTDKFQANIYNFMAQNQTFQITSAKDFSFAIIQCSKYMLEPQGKIKNIGNLTHRSTINMNQRQRINIKNRIIELNIQKPQNSNQQIELAQLYFDSHIINIKQIGIKTALQACEKADQIFQKFYKLPVCSIIINFNMACQLVSHQTQANRGSCSRQTRDLSFQLLLKCIDLLQRSSLNPLILAHSYERAAVFLFDRLSSIDLHMQSIRICQKINHSRLLRDNLQRMIKDYNISDNRAEELYAENQLILFGYLLGESPINRIQYFKRKINFFQGTGCYRLINKSLQQLMQLAHRHFPDDEQKEKEVRSVWKPYIVDIMAANVDVQTIKGFEKIMSKYAEDDYIHLKDAFRKKQAIAMNNNNNILMQFLELLQINQNDDDSS